MNNDKVIFLRAENGILVEVYHRTWDGSNVERKFFSNENVTDDEALADAMAFGFSRTVNIKPSLDVIPA